MQENKKPSLRLDEPDPSAIFEGLRAHALHSQDEKPERSLSFEGEVITSDQVAELVAAVSGPIKAGLEERN